MACKMSCLGHTGFGDLQQGHAGDGARPGKAVQRNAFLSWQLSLLRTRQVDGVVLLALEMETVYDLGAKVVAQSTCF